MSQRIPWHLSYKLKLHNLIQKYFVPLVSIDNVKFEVYNICHLTASSPNFVV